MEDNKNIITKKEYTEYFKSLLPNLDEPIDPKALSEFALKAFYFLLENYSDLDTEMQALADKITDQCKVEMDAALKKSPDTSETRKAKRLFRSIKYELPSASALMLALESKPVIKEPIILETGRLFKQYFQHYLDYLYEVSYEESHSGQASFAKLSMLFSITDELLVAFHMAQHGYINQAYAHIRTVYESVNLIELFIRDESCAELWYSSDERTKRKKLKPAVVRDTLGIKDDPLYRFLSVYGSHVTKAYVQSKSHITPKLSHKGNPQINFSIGGTRHLGHLLLANVNCMVVLSLAIIQLGKSFPTHIHQQDYEEVVENFVKDFIQCVKSYINFLKEAGINIEEIESYLDEMNRYLNETKSS